MVYSYKSILALFILLLLPFCTTSAQNPLIDSLTQAIENTQIDSLKIDLSIQLARALHRTVEHDTKDINVAIKAVEMGLESANPIYYARALNALGLLYRFHEHYDLSMPLHKKAFGLIENTDAYILDKMIFANNAGVAARYMSDYETAVNYYQIALKIAEKYNNTLNVEIASNGLGNIYMGIAGQEELGVSYFELALSTAELSGNNRGVAMNYLSLSSIYDARKDYVKAREYLNKLAQINQNMGDQLGIGLTHKSFGSSYLDEGLHLGLSEKHLLEAKQIFHQINNAIQEADVNYYLAVLQHKYGNNTQAINLLDQSLATAKKLDRKTLIIEVSKLLFSIYKEDKNYSKSLTFHMLWRDYQDSLNLHQQETEVLALNKKYDLGKKESEITSLKKEKEIHDFQLKSEKTKFKSRSAILILIAALFATLFIIFFQKNQNRRFIAENAKIQAQLDTERIKQTYERSLLEAEVIAMRMKINPHFLFNSLNSIKLLIQQNANAKAINYLVHLARFSRSLLDLENHATHSFLDEINLIKQYLHLESKRFKNDFSYSFSFHNMQEEDLEEYSIPPLLIQPYIENAIWHGLMLSEKENKEIKIAMTKRERHLEISIDDNGIGRQLKPLSGKRPGLGKGMLITKERILLYNKTNKAKIGFKIIDKTSDTGEPTGTQVLIDIKQ